MIERIYPNKKKLYFKFEQNEDDFFVEEQPITFSKKGSFLVLKIKKKNCDTWELIDRIAKFLRIYTNEIGYAGLKDKNATTIQYISIPKKYSKEIRNFRNKKIEVLDSYLHSSKLNIGDLKGNRFKINLYNVGFEELNHIQKLIKQISKKGMPNYFGYQRFGKDSSDNIEKAKELIHDDRLMKDRKVEKMLISAYQSTFFNEWLVERLNLDMENFKLLDGDIFYDIKNDKIFTPKSLNAKLIQDFENKYITPTGLLPGRKVFKATSEAGKVESKFDDAYIKEKGYRREAIVFPSDINCSYNKENKKCTLDFILPKGSYATVLIEYLANKNFNS